MVFKYMAGLISIGSFTMYIGAANEFYGTIASVLRLFERTKSITQYFGFYREFMGLPEQMRSTGRVILETAEPPVIEMRNVSFRYPGREDNALNHIDLTIQPNEHIAIVGENGAGKTTIVKLLFRFYDPDFGCIKLDGVDLKEYDVYAVRSIFGVLFQDYVQYALPLREIIALSDFEKRFDDAKLKDACDISGLSNVIMDWRDGFNSPLGTYYSDN